MHDWVWLLWWCYEQLVIKIFPFTCVVNPHLHERWVGLSKCGVHRDLAHGWGHRRSNATLSNSVDLSSIHTHLFKFKLTKNDFNIPQSNSSVTLAIFQELTNHKCRRSTILENTNSITVKVLSNGAGSFNLVSKTQAQ